MTATSCASTELATGAHEGESGGLAEVIHATEAGDEFDVAEVVALAVFKRTGFEEVGGEASAAVAWVENDALDGLEPFIECVRGDGGAVEVVVALGVLERRRGVETAADWCGTVPEDVAAGKDAECVT